MLKILITIVFPMKPTCELTDLHTMEMEALLRKDREENAGNVFDGKRKKKLNKNQRVGKRSMTFF